VEGTEEFIASKRVDARNYQAVSVKHRGAAEVIGQLAQALPGKLRARINDDKVAAELQETWDKVLGEENGDAVSALRRMLLDLIAGVGKELIHEAGAQSRLSDERMGQAREAMKIASELEAMEKQAAEQPPAVSGDEEVDADAGGDAGK